MDDPQFQLIAEQLGRLKDNIESRFQVIEQNASHEKELSAEKFLAVTTAAANSSKALDVHETRIRNIKDTLTGLQSAHSLGQAAQAALSLILAALAAWLGSRW